MVAWALRVQVRRAEAARRGIGTIRTLGILRDASALELVDLGASSAKLRNTSFRAPASFMDDLLDQEAKRRTSGG